MKRKKERKEKDMDNRKNNYERGEIYGCCHAATPKLDALLGV